MIKYLTQDEINRSKWDMCIDEAFNGLVYAKSWYLDIVAEDWAALVENNYEKIFPLVHKRKWGIHYLFQPVFTQQLGLFSKSLLSEEDVKRFFEAIPSKFKFAEINLNKFNKIPNGNFKVENWLTHELDLINSYDNIRKNFSSNLKRNLKKSEKAGLSVSKNIKPEEIIKLFRENRGKNIRNLADDDYLKLSRLAYSGIYKGMITNYGVYTQNNNLCAGAIFLHSKKKTIFLFSGLDEEGKKSGAMAFLINAYIQESQQNHLTLDFEGSNDPNLARFYKSFGSKEVYYPHIRINRLNFIVNFLVQIAKKMR